jgi:hypothetical protein
MDNVCYKLTVSDVVHNPVYSLWEIKKSICPDPEKVLMVESLFSFNHNGRDFCDPKIKFYLVDRQIAENSFNPEHEDYGFIEDSFKDFESLREYKSYLSVFYGFALDYLPWCPLTSKWDRWVCAFYISHKDNGLVKPKPKIY